MSNNDRHNRQEEEQKTPFELELCRLEPELGGHRRLDLQHARTHLGRHHVHRLVLACHPKRIGVVIPLAGRSMAPAPSEHGVTAVAVGMAAPAAAVPADVREENLGLVIICHPELCIWAGGSGRRSETESNAIKVSRGCDILAHPSTGEPYTHDGD